MSEILPEEVTNASLVEDAPGGYPGRQVTASGVNVTYYDSEDAHGKPDVLVMVPGTGGSTRGHFGFLFPILAAHRRVISIDPAEPVLDGKPLQLDDLIGQVTAVIERAVPGQKVVLLGYSLGGVVATALAARRPDLVSRLIVLSGWLRTDAQQLLRNDAWTALRKADEKALRAYMTFCAFGGPYLAMMQPRDLEAAKQSISLSTFLDQQMELNRRIDIAELAESVAAPSLVLGGTHDIMVPLRHQKAIFGAIVDCRFSEIPAGHAVVFERPSEVCFHVQQFIDQPNKYGAGSIIPTPAP